MATVVWVLGSGFSRHVGGPLLDELLSSKGRSLVAARYEDGGDFYPEVCEIYEQHRGPSGARLWNDAEQFLDLLDQARTNPGLGHLITQHLGGDHSPAAIDFLWQSASRAIADECRFCDQAFTGGEAWNPYKDWYRCLGDYDSVITFNYDRVLETLGLSAPFPSKELAEGRLMRNRAYKLHGSVDWALEDGVFVSRSGRDHTPFIATPGPTKFSHTKDEGPLAPLWSAASIVLTGADAVVFMGYRFPPTDSHALSSLLGALGRNKRPRLRLFTVLGPDTKNADTVRLEQLLIRTMKSAGRYREPVDDFAADHSIEDGAKLYDVRVLPLYAQDYMATLNRAEFG